MIHIHAFLRRLGTCARTGKFQASRTNRHLAIRAGAMDSLIHGLLSEEKNCGGYQRGKGEGNVERVAIFAR